jgi:hypothetical protein
MRQQLSRPFDPVEAYKPPRLKGTMQIFGLRH